MIYSDPLAAHLLLETIPVVLFCKGCNIHLEELAETTCDGLHRERPDH